MKTVVLIFFLLVVSCGVKKTVAEEKTSQPAELGKPDKLYSISGFVTKSSSYCGGARPTDEVLRKITTPKPYSGFTFYIREGKLNDVGKDHLLEITTDQDGKFSFEVPPGDYVIIEAARLDSNYYHTVLKTYAKETDSYSAADTACMNKWLNGFLFQFSVKDADLSNASWNIHNGCWTDVPCIHYRGPLPP